MWGESDKGTMDLGFDLNSGFPKMRCAAMLGLE
jgi:hypothetical protein